MLKQQDRNTIVFRLNVSCGRDAKEDEKIRKKMESKWKGEGLVSGYDVADAQKRKKKKGKTSREDEDEEAQAEDDLEA